MHAFVRMQGAAMVIYCAMRAFQRPPTLRHTHLTPQLGFALLPKLRGLPASLAMVSHWDVKHAKSRFSCFFVLCDAPF